MAQQGPWDAVVALPPGLDDLAAVANATPKLSRREVVDRMVAGSKAAAARRKSAAALTLRAPPRAHPATSVAIYLSGFRLVWYVLVLPG